MMNFSNETSTKTFSVSSMWLLQFSLWPLRFVCPILILFCPIANWTCISIFQSRSYRHSSSRWYFIFIGIFDTIYVLVTAPLIFLLTFQIYILNWNIFLCKSIVFLNYFSCQISAGLLACLSMDRLIATSCLITYRHQCTTKISKYVCLVVLFLFSILNSHYLIGYSIDSNGHCNMRHYSWYEKIYSRLNFVYLLSYSIIPFLIIAICNICIVISVCQSKSTIKKKYSMKKSVVSGHNPSEGLTISGNPTRLCPPDEKSSFSLQTIKYSSIVHNGKSSKKNLVIHKLLPANGQSNFRRKSKFICFLLF